MSAVGSCVGVCVYQGISHSVLLVALLIWIVVSLKRARDWERGETIWSVSTAFTLLLVWLLVPINQLIILYNHRSIAVLTSYIVLVLAGPVLLGECVYGLAIHVNPLCLWYPVACQNASMRLVLAIVIWDLFILLSLLSSYLCLRSSHLYLIQTLSERRYRQARLALIGRLDPLSAPTLCAICLENLARPIRLRCGHTFHGGCLEEWLARRMICPVCRAAVLAY
jgi:hypothetical protein